MTFEELKAEAEKHEYALVPKDQISTIHVVAQKPPSHYEEHQRLSVRSRRLLDLLRNMITQREIEIEGHDEEREHYCITVVKPEWGKNELRTSD